jgi:hypothetical protein
VARNLEGARERLRRVPDGDAVAGLRFDLPGVLDAIDRRLAELAAGRATDPILVSWSSR